MLIFCLSLSLSLSLCLSVCLLYLYFVYDFYIIIKPCTRYILMSWHSFLKTSNFSKLNINTRGAIGEVLISCHNEMNLLKIGNCGPFVLSNLQCDLHQKLTRAHQEMRYPNVTWRIILSVLTYLPLNYDTPVLPEYFAIASNAYLLHI